MGPNMVGLGYGIATALLVMFSLAAFYSGVIWIYKFRQKSKSDSANHG